MPNTVTYPFDPTGLAATNLVANEQHTLTSVNSTTYRLIIPKFAPFHVNNFEMVHITMDGVETPLTEGVDFNFVFLYLGASRSIGTVVYGGISLLNELVDGYIKIKRYQTLGGEWCCDQQYVLNLLADIVFNPRTVPWEKLTNVQQVFPPINHDQAMDWIKGHDDLIQAVNGLADTIVNGGQLREQNLSLLIRNMVMTAVQVGLGDVQNLPLATSAEVAAVQPVNKYITLAQAIQLLNGQISNLNQAGGALTTQNISDFTDAVNVLINTFLQDNPITVTTGSVAGLSQLISQQITDTLDQTLVTIQDIFDRIQNVLNTDRSDIDGLNQHLQLLTQTLQQLRDDLNNHNHDATKLDNLQIAVMYAMGRAFSDGIWCNKNGTVNIAEAGVDYAGMDSRNIYTMTQVLSRNTTFVEPDVTGTQWDVATNQNFRVKLTSNLSNFDIIGLDQWVLGAEVRMTVLNQGGDIVWPPYVLFSDGVVPNLTLTPGKYDIFTFTVESPDGVDYFLLNTGFKGNL